MDDDWTIVRMKGNRSCPYSRQYFTHYENAAKFYAFKIDKGQTRQSKLYEHLCNNKIELMKEHFIITRNKVALCSLKANASTEANICLSVLPKNKKYELSNLEISTFLCYKYGLPPPKAKYAYHCRTCGNSHDKLDSYGLHLATGCKRGGYAIKTHNSVKQELLEICRFAGLETIHEDRTFITAQPGGITVPAGTGDNESDTIRSIIPDITIKNPSVLGFSANITKVLLDVSIVQYAPQNYEQETCKAALDYPKKSLHKRYKDKIGKYSRFLRLFKQQHLDNNNYQIIPIVLLSTGTIHPQSMNFIAKLAQRAHHIHDMESENLQTFFVRRLVFALIRGISDAINGRIQLYPHATTDYTFDPNIINEEEQWINNEDFFAD